jgi:hypothetical protein
MASSKLQAFLNHPAGPKTGELIGIFFILLDIY